MRLSARRTRATYPLIARLYLLRADIAAGAKARLEADPSFLFKLGIEVGMDEVITCGVNVAARGSPFLWSPETALQVLAQVRPSCARVLAISAALSRRWRDMSQPRSGQLGFCTHALTRAFAPASVLRVGLQRHCAGVVPGARGRGRGRVGGGRGEEHGPRV
jgi:hypothetical protein